MSKITKLYRDADLTTNIYLMTPKLISNPIKSEKSGGKGSVASLKKSIQLGLRFPRYRAPEIVGR